MLVFFLVAVAVVAVRHALAQAVAQLFFESL